MFDVGRSSFERYFKHEESPSLELLLEVFEEDVFLPPARAETAVEVGGELSIDSPPDLLISH